MEIKSRETWIKALDILKNKLEGQKIKSVEFDDEDVWAAKITLECGITITGYDGVIINNEAGKNYIGVILDELNVLWHSTL